MVEHSQFYVISHIGNSRDKQEDSFLLRQGGTLPLDARESMGRSRIPYSQLQQNSETSFIVAISDGMGGHASGEVASNQTVKYLSENYHRIIDRGYRNEQFLINEIGALNRWIVSYSKSDVCLRGMGATLCGVICSKGLFYGVNVGDSRLYRYYNQQLEQLSTDHTEGQRLLKLNLLTQDEYRRFPRKKNLYKYVGINGELIADVFKIEHCVSGSLLLLCSDGLTDALSNEEISAILSKDGNIEYKGRLLVDQAVERNIGCGDNITLILIEL